MWRTGWLRAESRRSFSPSRARCGVKGSGRLCGRATERSVRAPSRSRPRPLGRHADVLNICTCEWVRRSGRLRRGHLEHLEHFQKN